MSSVIEETQVTPSGTQLGLTKAQQKKIVLYISVSGRVQIPGRLIELPAQRPRKLASHIQFGLLRGPHLRIKKPIQLTILRKRGSVVAHWKEIDEFGYGRNMSEAVDDFSHTIEELYFGLKSRQGTLSADLERIWDTLNAYILEAGAR